jgi:hypothetical protein
VLPFGLSPELDDEETTMAKAKNKKGSGKSKKDTDKGLGSKVAKSVKKSGLMDLIGSDLGREILADALIAAAGAAAAALTQTRTAKKAGAAVADAGAQTADLTQTAAGTVAGVVTEAARHFLPSGLLGENGEPGKSASKAKAVRRPSKRKAPAKAKTAGNSSANDDAAE